ncbi:helix-turn-helix transcriptional regulator [Oscillospiraceae bacterium CM]|nr:helix-turn-helix transcriptional regulator [Oscillospiraceae bacterium CM]
MISYAPLWKTMKEIGVTPYALRYKYNVGGGTIQRLKKNETVSTNTLDILCKVLNCPLHQVAEFVPD